MKQSLTVVKIQQQLRALGYYKGLIDADYGKGTRQAVIDMQDKSGLLVDGVAGSNTQLRLNALTSNAWLNLFIHCSATYEGKHYTGEQVKLWHTLPTVKGGRGWSRAGYSDVIELDGKLVNLRPYDQDNLIGEWEYTFGVKWNTLLNRNARHVCYIGGCPPDTLLMSKDTRTEDQNKVLEIYIKYQLLRNPNLVIAGHNQVQNKGCPSFDVPKWLESIGIPKYNIANWGKLYK
jgi:N-acetylmuramoyl-L-alanine amidase